MGDKIRIETKNYILTGQYRSRGLRTPIMMYNFEDFRVEFKWNG